MQYTIVTTKMHAVNISEDRKSVKIDYTVNAKAIDGSIEIPINEGCTIELDLPEGMAELAEKKVKEWFEGKYKSS